jgi:hypothetical protein
MRIKTAPERDSEAAWGMRPPKATGGSRGKGFSLAEQSRFYCGRFWIFPDAN